MSAAQGNKYAEKWTVEDARVLVDKAYDAIGGDCYFISAVAEKVGTYRELFGYLLKKFNDDEHVFLTLKKVYNKCESIVMQRTADNKINPALGIFVLKAYHGLFETSKQAIDHTTQGEKINLQFILPDAKD